MHLVELGAENEVAFLYRDHRMHLVRVAYLLTGSVDVADEIVQEAFTRLLPAMDRTREPLAYLRVIVTNLARGHHRRQTVVHRHPPSPSVPVLPPDVDEIWSQLRALPERERAAIVLRFYADLDVAGVADALGCRLGTAKSLIHRGLGHLREVLAP